MHFIIHTQNSQLFVTRYYLTFFSQKTRSNIITGITLNNKKTNPIINMG